MRSVARVKPLLLRISIQAVQHPRFGSFRTWIERGALVRAADGAATKLAAGVSSPIHRVFSGSLSIRDGP